MCELKINITKDVLEKTNDIFNKNTKESISRIINIKDDYENDFMESDNN